MKLQGYMKINSNNSLDRKILQKNTIVRLKEINKKYATTNCFSYKIFNIHTNNRVKLI